MAGGEEAIGKVFTAAACVDICLSLLFIFIFCVI